MRLIQNKFIFTMALSVALVGCGGGDDGGNGSSGPAIPLVEGEMAFVNVTGKNFQSENIINESAFSNQYCGESTAYYETEYVMAYASGSHSEAELRRVASTVEYAMKGLVGKFQFADMADFMDQKRKIPYSLLDQNNYPSLITEWRDKDTNEELYLGDISTYFSDNPPEGYTGWDDPQLRINNSETALIRSALVTEPDGAKAASALLNVLETLETRTNNNGELSSYKTQLNERMIHDKIQVCVLPDGSKGAAAGHSIGFDISANEQYSFYVHEGAHFIQKQFAEKLPRWMSEGQAVVFSNQGTASAKSGTDIVKILTYDDESLYNASFYDHYGLAYKALAKNRTVPEIMKFLQTYDLNPVWLLEPGVGYDYNLEMAKHAWSEAFPGWVTYEEFAQSYDTLAK